MVNQPCHSVVSVCWARHDGSHGTACSAAPRGASFLLQWLTRSLPVVWCVKSSVTYMCSTTQNWKNTRYMHAGGTCDWLPTSLFGSVCSVFQHFRTYRPDWSVQGKNERERGKGGGGGGGGRQGGGGGRRGRRGGGLDSKTTRHFLLLFCFFGGGGSC